MYDNNTTGYYPIGKKIIVIYHPTTTNIILVNKLGVSLKALEMLIIYIQLFSNFYLKIIFNSCYGHFKSKL